MQRLKVASDIAGFDFFPVSVFRVQAPIGLGSGVSVDNDTAFGTVTGLFGSGHIRVTNDAHQEKMPMRGVASAFSQVVRRSLISEAGKAGCQSCDRRQPSGHT